LLVALHNEGKVGQMSYSLAAIFCIIAAQATRQQTKLSPMLAGEIVGFPPAGEVKALSRRNPQAFNPSAATFAGAFN
jgi:hypothetical protein